MVQRPVQLSDVLDILDVPHVDAVVTVHGGQVLGGGVKGEGQGMWILGTRSGR